MDARRGLTEGILIAAGSAVAYAVAYNYQSFYFSYFDLPPLFLSPTTGMILKAAGAVGGVLFTLWLFANSLWFFAPPGQTAVQRAVRRFIAYLVFGEAVIFVAADGSLPWKLSAAYIPILALVQFAVPLLTQRGQLGYERKLEAQEMVEERVQGRSLQSEMSQTVGSHWILLVAMSAILVSFAGLLGRQAARNQKNFYVLQGDPDAAAVYMGHGTIIFARYNPKTLVLNGNYIVERFTDGQKLQLERRHIGKLKPPARFPSE